MAISMTREEYQRKYGVAPVINASKLDTSVAPRRMTRQEYEAEFNPKSESDLADIKSAETYKPFVPAKTGEGAISAGLKTAANLPSSAFGLVKGLAESALSPVKTVKTLGETLAGGVEKLIPGKQKSEDKFDALTGFLKENYAGTTNLQRKVTNDPVGFATDILSVLEGGAGLVGKTKQLNKALSTTAQVAEKPFAQGAELVAKSVKKTPEKIISQREAEIFNIENNYAKTRKVNDFAQDAGAGSRKRIAETDVLVGAVDEDGLIRTKQPGGAVEQYTKLRIDGVEDVVKQNLIKEAKVINLGEVEKSLKLGVANSGLEGADLVTALKGIKNEIEGLRMRADEFGNVPLSKIHEAKINTTKHINYLTPPETATYRKAVARGYKTLIEDKSSVPVKEINAELAKYYKDIERLELLDGKKVKGGKLGKYFSQITGNIVGGAAGGLVGGLGGGAVGTVIGGEVAGALKGKSMASAFGKEAGLNIEKNAILEEAKRAGSLPPSINLKAPDLKVGAPKVISKTPEITKLESQISKNVDLQKQAIKAGNFDLVATLKELYQVLVDRLKAEIVKIKNIPNKQGGFVKNPLAKTDPLIQEAKKYKSAEDRIVGEAIKKHLEGNGVKVNPDNTVTLYHATSPENIAKINKEGIIKGGSTATSGMTGLDLKPSAFFGTDLKWTKDTWGKSGKIIEVKVPVEDIRQPAQNTKEVYFEGGLKKDKDGIWRPILKPRSTFYDRMLVKGKKLQ